MIHTPILTGQDCEGAGELFSVADSAAFAPGAASAADAKYLLGKRASLTVSGQLHLETAACALGRVYTFNPAFRADPSTTARHLCEFWMVEPEMAWADIEAASYVVLTTPFCEGGGKAFLNLCSNLAEKCVLEVSQAVADRCAGDLALLDTARRFELQQRGRAGAAGAAAGSSAAARAQIPLDGKPFVRMTYDEAVDALQRSGEVFHTRPEWGKRLATEHEQWLCGRYCSGRPVFVMHFPTTAASFYARQNDAGSPHGPTAATFDLLTSAGELIGGGVREERLPVLQARMVRVSVLVFVFSSDSDPRGVQAAAGLSPSEYGWYLDLRRYGSVPHAGWGLGFERLLMALTGVENIRETMLIPRAPGSCLL
jgi:asparaginyl-tRNA synthetase